jgi:hypothetical protein
MEKQYRLLRDGEQIQNGDQFNWGTDERPEWGDTTCQGDYVKEGGDYRREVASPILQDVVAQLEKLTRSVELFVEAGGKESISLRVQRKNARKLLDSLIETK